MIQVKSFLGCFPLESFALVIGWLHLIPMVLLALLSTSALVNEVINQSELVTGGICVKITSFICRRICRSCAIRIVTCLLVAGLH